MTAISTPVKALWVRCTAVWTIVLLSTAQCALQIQFGRLYRSYRMSRNAELGTEGWELRGLAGSFSVSRGPPCLKITRNYKASSPLFLQEDDKFVISARVN